MVEATVNQIGCRRFQKMDGPGEGSSMSPLGLSPLVGSRRFRGYRVRGFAHCGRG